MNIVSQASIHVAPDEAGAGGADITANSASFARHDHTLQLDGSVVIQRGSQRIEADAAVGHLSEDERRVERLDLHNHARINASGGGPGSLEALSGAEMTLNYAPDGQSLQRALIFDEAAIRLAGEAGKPGRQISSRTLDITMAPDGSTPTLVAARENVVLTFPPDESTPERRIEAAALDARGEAGRGLTRAMFSGDVKFREKGAKIDRAASAVTLEVITKPGMGTIEEAVSRIASGSKKARWRNRGGEPLRPGEGHAGIVWLNRFIARTSTTSIAIGATRIDVTLEVRSSTPKARSKARSCRRRRGRRGDAKATNCPRAETGQGNCRCSPISWPTTGPIGRKICAGVVSGRHHKGRCRTIDEKTGDLFANGKAMSSTTRNRPTRTTRNSACRHGAERSEIRGRSASPHLHRQRTGRPEATCPLRRSSFT
jgi:hypothetical protein